MSAIAVMLILWSWSWILFFYGVLEKGREAMQEAPILDQKQVNEDGPNHRRCEESARGTEPIGNWGLGGEVEINVLIQGKGTVMLYFPELRFPTARVWWIYLIDKYNCSNVVLVRNLPFPNHALS